MAQLNDLLVLGNTSLIGETKISSDIIAPQLILETATGEGGQIQLKTALNDATNSGIVIDTANGDFRLFGLPSRNGSTRTGNGTALTIDPYDKTINGGYSFDGISARTQKIETWYSDKSRTYGASYPLYAWWETNSECRLTVDNYTVKVNYADISGLANSVAWGNVTGKPSSYPPSSHTHDFITYKDTRNDNQTPDNLQAGVTIHLKGNGTDGLSDGGSYHPILAFKDWGDYSGGPYGQIATTANQNLYFIASTSGTTWGSWYKVAIQNKDNTFSGTNTFSGQVIISNTTDAALSSASGALRIGAISGEHIAIDGNEIMAKTSASAAGILYLNNEGGLVQIGSGGLSAGNTISSTIGFQVNRTNGDGCGLGLYGASAPNTYGIHMSKTATYGTFGHVSSDWATYFCFEGAVNRGWIFKHAGNNVFSINGSGTLSIRENVPGIFFRPGHASYDAVMTYETSGNEAMLFTTKNAITSFMFVNGEDIVTNNAADRWTKVTPGLQIKNNCVAIGKLIASGTNPSYKLEVNGTSLFSGKMQVNAPIFGYNYTNNSNAAAFIWDKPGSNYTGVGANGTADTIYFGACSQDGTWVTSYKQKWVFNGSVTADTVAGAVWNDYAEYRKQKENIKPGYCVISTDNGEIYKTTEKFQVCDGIVSDTFGFSIGETDECKTPLAVAGRVLAYCYGDKNDYHSGDIVCAGPEGKVYKMTREEIKEYPDRIIGHVSEIPNYEYWGTGNVKVDNRIWIKVK